MFPLVTIYCWNCGMETSKTKPLLPRRKQIQMVSPLGRQNAIWTLTCFWMDVSDGRQEVPTAPSSSMGCLYMLQSRGGKRQNE